MVVVAALFVIWARLRPVVVPDEPDERREVHRTVEGKVHIVVKSVTNVTVIRGTIVDEAGGSCTERSMSGGTNGDRDERSRAAAGRALLRRPAVIVRHEVMAALHAAGFDDVLPAHLGVFQHPGPDGQRPGVLAMRTLGVQAGDEPPAAPARDRWLHPPRGASRRPAYARGPADRPGLGRARRDPADHGPAREPSGRRARRGRVRAALALARCCVLEARRSTASSAVGRLTKPRAARARPGALGSVPCGSDFCLPGRVDRCPPGQDDAATPRSRGVFLCPGDRVPRSTHDEEDETMSEQDQSDQHRDDQRYDDQHYDVAAAQDKWRKVWDDLNPFQAADDGVTRAALRADDVPLPQRRPAHGPRRGDGAARRHRPLLVAARLRRAEPDRLGLVRPAGRERRDQARRAPARRTPTRNIETQAESFRRYGISFDWSRRLHTSDPEYYRWTQWLFLRFRERGLAYRKFSPVNWCPNDQTVLANEQVVDGMCERCGAEVTKRELTQWYFKITDYAQRLLDDMDAAGGALAGAGAGHAAQLDRPLRRRARRLRPAPARRRDAPADRLHDAPGHRCTARRSWWSPPTPSWPPRSCAPEQREAARGLPGRGPQGDRDRAAVHRPAPRPVSFLGVTPINPVDGERHAGLGRRLRAGRLRHRRDHGGARRTTSATWTSRRTFGLPVVASSTPATDDPAETVRRHHGDGVLRQLRRRWTGWRQEAGIAAIIERPGDRGPRRGAVNFRLRDWLLSRQRFWGAPIPIIHCPGCGEVPVPDDQLPVELPELQGRRPEAEGDLAAGRGRRTGSTSTCPTCGGPAKRDTDTMDTFVDSSWYFLRYCSPARRRRPVRPRGGARLDAGRPVRRRRRARDPAPAVQPVLHQGAARHGAWSTSSSRSRALLNQGMVINQRPQDEQVAGQRRRPGGAAGGRSAWTPSG